MFQSFTIKYLNVDLFLFVLLRCIGLIKFVDSCISIISQSLSLQNGLCLILSLSQNLLEFVKPFHTVFQLSKSLFYVFYLVFSWLHSNNFFQIYFKVYQLSLQLLSNMLLMYLLFIISIIFLLTHFIWFYKLVLIILYIILFLAHIFELVYQLFTYSICILIILYSVCQF